MIEKYYKTASSKINPEIKGCLFILLASATFPAMSALVKLLSNSINTIEIAFFRCVFGLLILLPLIFMSSKNFFYTKKIHLHFLRSLLGVAAMAAGFFAISLLPLANVTSISFSKILFIIPLAVIIFKEKPGKYLILSTLIGYLGVFCVIGFEKENSLFIGYTFALIASLIVASIKILVKEMSSTEHALTIQIWFGVISSICIFFPTIFIWTMPTIKELLYLILLALLGTTAQLLTIYGLKNGKATVVMPMDYFRIIFAMIYGYVFFSEIPTINVFIGGFLILLTSFYILRKNY